MLSHASLAAALLDHEGRFHGCNEAFARLLGHSSAELEGDLAEVVVDPADRENLRRAIRETEAEAAQTTSVVDLRLLSKWDRAIPCRLKVCRININGYRHVLVVDQLIPAPQGEACPPVTPLEWWEVAIARARENWVFIAAAATLLFKFALDYESVKTTQALQERQFIEIRAILDRLDSHPAAAKTRNRQEGP